MLQFILGRACTGKTARLFNILEECIRENKQTIFLVPEQFSFETEKAILQSLGDKKASMVSVLTFSRICDEVTRELGGSDTLQLTDFGKNILLNRALRECRDELKIWKKYVNHLGFASSVLDSIEEFKLNAVEPSDLRLATEQMGSGNTAAKLIDLAKIYEVYNSLIGERFSDPSDRLTRVYYQLLESNIFKNKTIFIDGFKGFTGQQYRIFERIFADCDTVYISLTDNTHEYRRYDAFHNIREVAQKIKRIARAHNVKCEEDIVLEKQYFKGVDIAATEKALAGEKGHTQERDGTVTICEAKNIYQEAQFVAHTIRNLVRTKNYRYRDFVIIARNTEPYEQAVISACEKNEVRCFSDRRRTLADFPTAKCILAAFDAIAGYKTEAVLRFLKSGLGILSVEELSTLENYTQLWNINGKRWLQDWDMSPEGFVSGTPKLYEERLEHINSLRKRAIFPLKHFKDNFKGNAKERISAIITFLNECNAKDAFLNISKELKSKGESDSADALRQSWDILIGIFNSLVNCYGDEDISSEEFCNVLRLALFGADIGVSPQTLDEVCFGAADRIRPSRPKIAFILGANQGVFPANIATGGLFATAERQSLINCGIEIPDRSINTAIDEEFLVYTNVCCATDRLYISYSTTDPSQNEQAPAQFVTRLLSRLDIKKEYANAKTDILPETASSAFSMACANVLSHPQFSSALFSALPAEYIDRAKQAGNCNRDAAQKISKESAKALFGNEMRVSASRLDTYKRCRFQYFCRYGLRAKKLQPADFDVLQRGTLIHFCLQRYFEEYGKNVANLEDNEVKAAAEKYIDEYLNSVPGFYSIRSPRIEFLLKNISRSISEVMLHLRDEFRQSEFEPKYCEFEFGMENTPSVNIEFDGGKIMLNGSIDRVDIWNGYVRIVDYKSGSRTFKLPDILVGQNLQMLLYLFAITRIKDFSELKPAGIFYMPAKRDKDGTGLAMNGLLVCDEQVVRAMDRENSGEFVPSLKINKNGELSKTGAASFIQKESFNDIFNYIERLLKTTGKSILSGDISINPVDSLDSPACKYCDFAAVCTKSQEIHAKVEKMSNQEVLEKISEEAENSGT